MIRLGKDKTLDNYFIDENGVIIDEKGQIQELKIGQGRSYFKLVAVHKIQMWTNYGWRDTKIWAIHHIDENKQNNSLSNLIFLTRKEHTSLHNKGKKLSQETKQKLSELKNKNLSEETKRKISEAFKGFHWFNDGIKNYRCKECPPGCVEGLIKK